MWFNLGLWAHWGVCTLVMRDPQHGGLLQNQKLLALVYCLSPGYHSSMTHRSLQGNTREMLAPLHASIFLVSRVLISQSYVPPQLARTQCFKTQDQRVCWSGHTHQHRQAWHTKVTKGFVWCTRTTVPQQRIKTNKGYSNTHSYSWTLHLEETKYHLVHFSSLRQVAQACSKFTT